MQVVTKTLQATQTSKTVRVTTIRGFSKGDVERNWGKRITGYAKDWHIWPF